ncbi:MAG: GNAT family N-acetyltransferase [Dongiaceae bacterium]
MSIGVTKAVRPTVRDASIGDLPIIHSIYAHHVCHGLASFEEAPPDVGELTRRRDEIVARGLPYVVVERAGDVCAFAYATPYRARSAYRYTVEDSVYVAPDATGQGLGRAAVAEVIRRCDQLELRQMIAVIGDSNNLASIRLHERLGFRHAGTLASVGFKFGRWVDSVIMQRPLGSGDSSAPNH